MCSTILRQKKIIQPTRRRVLATPSPPERLASCQESIFAVSGQLFLILLQAVQDTDLNMQERG